MSITLQTLSHEQLIREVQTRITGRPATTTSHYLRLPTVPAVQIMPYPKRKTSFDSVTRSSTRWASMPASQRPAPTPDEVTYADFLRPVLTKATTAA